jgi:CBS domain-containing protein
VSLSQLRAISATDEEGRGAGRVVDVVVRWTGSDAYPPVTGVVLQLGEEELFHPTTQLARLDQRAVVVRSSETSAQPFSRREGELRLVQDVLGRQLVDVDGVKVLRAEELYLAQVMGRLRLVAVAGGPRSLLARVLAGSPAERRRLVDWSAVQPFGEPGSELRLQLPHEGIRRLHPGELADLLEELDRPAREELAGALETSAVADALEEMEPERIEDLLREVSPERAAQLVAEMELDALRDMERAEADAIIAKLPAETARQITEILGYPETMAGGFMTTALALAQPAETVAEVRQRLRQQRPHGQDIDSVAVVDEEGRLLADVPLFELLASSDDTPLSQLVGDSEPVTIHPEAFLDEVVDRLTDARASSVVVVDPEGRPKGRVLADDVIDALKEGGLRLKLPWLFR